MAVTQPVVPGTNLRYDADLSPDADADDLLIQVLMLMQTFLPITY